MPSEKFYSPFYTQTFRENAPFEKAFERKRPNPGSAGSNKNFFVIQQQLIQTNREIGTPKSLGSQPLTTSTVQSALFISQSWKRT